MTKTLHISSIIDKLDDLFVRIAFAEAGELWPAHPHKLHSVTEIFTEVAFAEGGEIYHENEKMDTPPKLCINGETSSGLCV